MDPTSPASAAAAIAARFGDRTWQWSSLDACAAALAASAHPDDAEAARALVATLGAGQPAQAVLRVRHDGGWVPLHVRALVVSPGGAGQPGRIVATGVDASVPIASGRSAAPRATMLDDRIAAAQKLESLGLLAGGIAHDFNNLLMAVLAEATVAKDDPNLTADARESLDQIELAAQRMAELTRQLLAYAGRGRFVLERLDPDALVRELAGLLRRSVRKDAQLTLFVGEGGAIEADPSQLRQVVMNLVINASDALRPEGGAIRVRTWLERHDGGAPGAWALEVVDDGLGMDEPTRSRIFDPFFTTKAAGHGLGLSAVAGIVHRIGGSIDVDSAPGQGARFTVRIPLCEAPPRPPRKAPGGAAAVLAGKRVLVADDEEAVRASMRRLLEHRGASVVEAQDGRAARAALASDRFELMFLDVNMPYAGAYDLLADARAAHPQAPIVLMSGYSESFTAKPGAIDDDGDLFLQKPFTLSEFDAALRRLLA